MTHDYTGARRRLPVRLAVALAVACMALAACTGADEAGQTDGTPAAAAGTGQDADDGEAGTVDEHQVDLDEARTSGEEISGGRFAVTVDGVDCEAGDAVAGVEATGRLCLLTLDVTNESDTAQSIELDRQVLIDDSGTEYALSQEATEAAGDLPESVDPGESVTLDLVYDIPEDALIVAARITDDAAADGVLVDLQD